MASPVAYVSRSCRCGPSSRAAACSTRAAATSAYGPAGHGPDAQLAGQLGDGLGTGQLLVATAVGLGDLPYERRAGHRQEADLARAAGPAAVQPSAEDERGTETALVPQQYEVLVSSGRAEPLLGDGDEVDVVLVLDRHGQRGREFVEEAGGVPAGQVRGVAQPPGVGVEGAGRADDEPVDVVPGRAPPPSRRRRGRR